MKGISINGQKLHEVQLPLVPNQSGTISHSLCPKDRIKFTEIENGIVLSIPPKLAVELYRKGIFPQEAEKRFSVHISGRRIGMFRIADFRYPNSISKEKLTITLTRLKAHKQ
jgi:hypothetical protein